MIETVGDQGQLPLRYVDTDTPASIRPLRKITDRVVSVVPDIRSIDKTFDYLVPRTWEEDGRAGLLRVGSQVRIDLAGRRVGAWVVEVDVEPAPDVNLRPLAHFGGIGPDAEIIDLAGWAARRWAGRRASFLKSASPSRRVRQIPKRTPRHTVVQVEGHWAEDAFKVPKSVVRIPPNGEIVSLLLAAINLGDTLVLVPTKPALEKLVGQLRQTGIFPSVFPGDWARAAAGGLVIGTRAAALAPVGDLSAVVVLDEHDESFREERAPTWNARDLAIERARRAEAPCVLVSPSPSLEALTWGHLFVPSRGEERQGWPILDVIDRRDDDPLRKSLLGEQITKIFRQKDSSDLRPVVCVLNRRGRSRLLACFGCGELALCVNHQVPLIQPDEMTLRCPVDSDQRPVVCASCGDTRFRNLREGVSRVREELEGLMGCRVVEVDSSTSIGELNGANILVGTEAVLHRVSSAGRVVFLDFDQELVAPRIRANEEAMALLVRAARLLGPRSSGGRLVVQTRQPYHEIFEAVLHANPARLVEPELERRRLLNLPPFSALARVSGSSASVFVEDIGALDGIEVMGPRDGSWLVRATGTDELEAAISTVERPSGRLRIEVDPARV